MTTPANSSSKNRPGNTKPSFDYTFGAGSSGAAGYLVSAETGQRVSNVSPTLGGSTSVNNVVWKAVTNNLWFPQSGKGASSGSGSKIKKTGDTKPPQPNYKYNENYKWNLPPHAWSMPVEPASVNASNSPYFGSSSTFHSLRRGRIFYCAGLAGNSVKASATEEGKLESGAKTGKSGLYGFQFIWNPESFIQSTAVNMKLTYSASDPTTALYALAPANATVNFKIRLDRTNDFACFNDIKHKKYDRDKSYDELAQNVAQVTAEILGKKPKAFVPYGGPTVDQSFAAKYYEKGKPLKSEKDFQDNMQYKLDELMKYGTMADLEYLYRAINGDGFSVLGRETSNLGYLFPTLVRLDLGPQKWVGVIKSIEVEHLAFTQDMVPIRTDVNLSFDVRASTANLSSSSDLPYNQEKTDAGSTKDKG